MNRFRIDGHPVLFIGEPVGLCDGDHVIVVGWMVKGELRACFLAMPAWGWFCRAHSVVPKFFIGAVLLVPAALTLKASVLLGLFLTGVSCLDLACGFDWRDGERLMLRVLLADRAAHGVYW